MKLLLTGYLRFCLLLNRLVWLVILIGAIIAVVRSALGI